MVIHSEVGRDKPECTGGLTCPVHMDNLPTLPVDVEQLAPWQRQLLELAFGHDESGRWQRVRVQLPTGRKL